MTAGMGRPRAVERKMGSRRVRWEQIKRTPEVLGSGFDFVSFGGGVPLIMTRTPRAQKA